MEFSSGYALLIFGGLLLASFYYFYVLLIRKRNMALEALSGIDVQIKKRANTIPNILKIASKYLKYEKELMTEITSLRAKATKNYNKKNTAEVKEHLAVAETLSGKMGQFMIAVENYPDLKADGTMMAAINSYNEVEEQIAAARRFYNSSVTDLNNSVQIFPISFVAKIVSVEQMPFYHVEESVKAPIDAGNFL